ADEPAATLAAAICRELTAAAPEVEVAWSQGRRTTVATRREPVESLPAGELPRGGTWVVTGGARGITAATALELGRRYGVKMRIWGNSPAPEANAPWRHAPPEKLDAIKTSVVREAIQAGRPPREAWDRVKKDREIQATLDAFRAAGVEATYHACDVANW